MNATPSAPAEIGAPSETVTSAATELNSSTATTLTKAPISTQCTATNNTLAAISAMSEGNPPKVCFLFGAGAEAYYGMPLGARFAVEIFRRQEKGKDIFTKIRNHFLQQLDPKNGAKLTNAQQQYQTFLPKDSPLRIYTLTSSNAGVLIRELIQDHYEDILKCFNEFSSEDKSIEIEVLKQLLNDGYDLRLLLLALRQILGLPAPATNDTKEYKKAPVTWARAELKKLVQEIEKKNFFTMLPEQIQDVAIKNDSGATESPQYSGEDFLTSLKFSGGESSEYAAIDNVWKMPLFTVIAICSHILYTRLHQKEERKGQISEKDTNVAAKLAYCNEITLESLQGILEIIAAASAQDYTNKGENDLARIQQFSPMFGTINLIRAINFDKVGSSLLKLLFEELSSKAASWKSSFEDAKELLKNDSPHQQDSSSQAEAQSKSKDTDKDFPSLQQMESALPALTLMAQELFFTVASEFISYKGLIDGMWRYLYAPKANWTKFSQLSCFLFAVHAYILEQAGKCSGEHGYYEQVREAEKQKLFTTGIFATTNYTTLIRERLFSQEEQKQLKDKDEAYYLEHPNERKLAYLNGSTSFIYDPYLNDMYEAPEESEDSIYWCKHEHFTVPLMFTQSGTKAMTVVEMNEMYASVFHSWLESDAVVLIGFNCNKDDAHINAMLRKFLKLSQGQKPIIIVTPDQNEELFANKLHLEDKYRSCLRLIGITDLVKNTVNNVMWYTELHRILQEWYKTPHDVKAQSNLASVASGTSDEA